jgi:hypothetical protein
MRVLGFLVAALLLILGVVGLLAPNRLFEMAQFTTTPTGVYVTGAIRLAIGVILFMAASGSRFPKVLRVLGVLIFIGGIGTFFIGSVGAQAIANSVATNGTIVLRLFGVVALVIGGFLAYAISDKSFDQTP